MAVVSEPLSYQNDGNPYEGCLFLNNSETAPGILVCHAWAGRSEFEDNRARDLAQQGYTVLAIDLYGVGVRGTSKEECSQLIAPFMADRSLLLSHMRTWLELLENHPAVDTQKTAVIGYCFGGLCALDLARSGADLRGAVSFHGLLGAPALQNDVDHYIAARILALHGWDDPMVTPQQVFAFSEEMSAAGADWQLHAYGNTVHAFTNPKANDPGFGTVYNAVADRRSWQSTLQFFAEVLA
jgi:dienelactone hydrolase